MSQTIAFYYSPKYEVDIGDHVFRTDKYRLVMEDLNAQSLLDVIPVIEPDPARMEDMKRAIEPAYLDDLIHIRWTPRTARAEMPISQEIVDVAFQCAGGTTQAARRAIEGPGIGFHVGGGWHHAFPSHGEGFCYINDIAVAIMALKAEEAIERALVVDLDLHQGNGTAVYFENDPSVFTFSMHQERLYPFKEQSDLDIGLSDTAGDEIYLDKLYSAIPRLYDEHRPELIIYVAGADPFEKDMLGTLQLTKEGLRKRDARVINEAAKRNIPLVVTLAGGYAPRVRDTVDIHTATAEVALQAASAYHRND